jgi:hypothetical protein
MSTPLKRRKGAWAALSAAVLCSTLLAFGASAGAATGTTATTNPTSGFVAAKGTELVVKGQPWKFAGYNIPCANPFDLTSSALAYYLNDIQQNSGANVIRVWFFQSQGGPGNWANFDRVIAAVKKRGMRALVTLTNEGSTCDEPDPTTSVKTLAWYQSGYLSPEGGYPLSFHDYAVAVAAYFARNPAVAFWQLVNEAAAPTISSTGTETCDEAPARDALRSFSDNMTHAIHAVDPKHLVDLGTLSTGDCGIGDDADFTYVHAGALDLCEFHDYGDPATAMPAALAGIVTDCHSLNKPVYVGESGIPANVGPDGTPNSTCPPPGTSWPSCSPYPITFQTLDQRATFFQAKIQAANQARVAGYIIWVKSPYYSDTTDGYAISDGDPVEGVLAQALQPYPSSAGPAADLPEAPWTAGLALVALATLGGGAYWLNRRNTSAGRT